eukprot:1083795-Amphidinium_carterae.1
MVGHAAGRPPGTWSSSHSDARYTGACGAKFGGGVHEQVRDPRPLQGSKYSGEREVLRMGPVCDESGQIPSQESGGHG